MGDIKRIYPGPVNGLINWIERNFHDIDQYVCIFRMKDATTMMTYDTYSYLEAVGLVGIATDNIHTLGRENEFIPKKRSDPIG